MPGFYSARRSSSHALARPNTSPQNGAPMRKIGTSATVTRKHTSAPNVKRPPNEAVNAAVVRLKESGFTSGYLKPLVVSRINPLRWVKADKDAPRPDLEKTLAKMLEGAKKFDPGKVKAADVAAAAWMGGGEEA